MGCEIYFVDDHADRSRRPRGRERNHLTLLAENDAGYRNLVKLSSAGFLEGLHRGKPTLDMGQLAAHAEGVIALTGCLASRFCQRLVDGRDGRGARARRRPARRRSAPRTSTSRSRRTASPTQDKANEGIVRIAREVGRPLVGTGDVHYLRREDYHHHTALLCVQTKSTLAAPKMTFDTNEFYLRSSDEMAQAFAEWPEALQSTLEIAERCDVDDRARPPAHPALPARRRGRARVPARARRGGPALPLRRPAAAPPRSSARRWSSASSTGWASTPTS